MKHEIIQLMRDGKDEMVVGNAFNQLRIPCHDPFLLQRSLTVGAAAVVTGTGMDLQMATFLAIADIITKTTGLAVSDTVGSSVLDIRHIAYGPYICSNLSLPTKCSSTHHASVTEFHFSVTNEKNNSLNLGFII